MSNFCSTGITFYSKDKQSMNQLKRRLDSVCIKAAKNSDCPIVYVAETFYPEIDSEKIECRGVFTSEKAVSQLNGYYILRVYTITPNSAKLGLWHRLIQDFYPEIKMAYISEECGNGYFVKWDEEDLFYLEDYYVDICYPTKDGDIGYIDEHEFATLESVYGWLDANLPFDYEKKSNECELEEEILSKMEELEDSDEYFCTIAKYMKISPSEYEFYKN